MSKQEDQGVCINFVDLILHAISRDLDNYPKQCIYCNVESKEFTSNSITEDWDQENNQSNELNSIEIRFIPEDPNLLQELHNAFCDGAALNPDEMNEEEGDFCYNSEEVMNHLDSIVTGPQDEQFDEHDEANNENEGYDEKDFGME